MIRPVEHARTGSALISTLFVIVVLTIVVIAFLQSMTVERQTARSYMNRYRAELAAKAGITKAESLLSTLFQRYPDSATAWQHIVQENTVTEGTVFHFRATPQSGSIFPDVDNFLTSVGGTKASAYNTGTTSQVDLFTLYLASGTQITKANSTTSTFPALVDLVDFNLFNEIGTPPSGVKPSLKARWVEVLQNPSKPRNLDRSSASFNPPIARYAYWIEDESFRLNINAAGNIARGAGTKGVSPAEANLNAPFRVATDGTSTNAGDFIVSMRESFPGQKILTLLTAKQSPNLPTTVFDQTKFSLTSDSTSLDLSRGGFKRINLNALFASSVSDPSSDPNSDPSSARQNLDRFITTIVNPNGAPFFGQRFYRTTDAPGLNLTDTVSTSDHHDTIYLQKIAANVKDFIDADNQPTLITAAPLFNVGQYDDPTENPDRPYPIEGVDPSTNYSAGETPLAAIGKEQIPYLQEVVVRTNVVTMSPPGWSGSTGIHQADYEFYIDYYLEFWNPCNVAISAAQLGENAHIRIYHQPELDTGGVAPTFPTGLTTPAGDPATGIPEGRDFAIRLSDIPELVFPPGAVTVITTDHNPNSAYGTPVGSNRFIAPLAANGTKLGDTEQTPLLSDATRRYKGVTKTWQTGQKTTGYPSNFNNAYRVLAVPRSTSTTDYQTGVLLGNETGLMDGYLGIGLARKDGSGYGMVITAIDPSYLNSLYFFSRGSSLRGNASKPLETGAVSGDPRSADEPLFLQIDPPSNSADPTYNYVFHYYNTMDDGPTKVPGFSSLYTYNSNANNTTAWPDPLQTPVDVADSNGGAYAVLKSDRLESIGELGNIYDPVRRQPNGQVSITLARGGGRTLRIGQSELYNTNNSFGLWASFISDQDQSVTGLETSASRTWTSWRLCDLFSVTDTLESSGKLNINGLRRDGGTAFEALIDGLTLSPSPQGSDAAAQPLEKFPSSLVTNLTKAILNRLSGDALGLSTSSPTDNADSDLIFWERGELSELSLFYQGSSLIGTSMNSTSSPIIDRSREEIFRRLIEMICTKGNTFTVYALGQALLVDGNGNLRTTATQKRAETFRLEPVYSASQTSTFVPPASAEDLLTATASGGRFAAPDSYTIVPVRTFSY